MQKSLIVDNIGGPVRSICGRAGGCAQQFVQRQFVGVFGEWRLTR